MNDAAFDALLEDMSRCFLERDLHLWISRVDLPLTIETRTDKHVLTTPEALSENFDNYLRAFDAMGLTLVDRRPIALVQTTDGTWRGTYETRLVRGTQLATAAYVSTATLSWDGEMFRLQTVLGARGHEDWTQTP